MRLRVGSRSLAPGQPCRCQGCGSRWRRGGRGLLVGGHVHLPPDRVRCRFPRLGRVEIRLGPAWVRYRGAASLIRRRRLTVGAGSGMAPRPPFSRLRVTLPRCWPSRWCPSTAMPTAPTCPARLRLLGSPALAVAVIPARPGAAQESARTGFPDFRFIGSPADGSRLLPNNYEAAPGPRSAGRARPPVWLAPMPARPRAVPSPHRYSDHGMPKAKTAPVDDRYRPCLSPRSRSNLQHHPDGTPVDAGSARVSLTERSSRRHARSPGEAGEVAAIFAMITTNPTRSIGELGLGTMSSMRPPSCSQATAACSSSSGDGCPRGMRSCPPTWTRGSPSSATTGRAERPCRCHIERLPGLAVPIVLEASVYGRDVVEAQRIGRRHDPVRSTSLRVDHGEACCPVGDGQGKTG